MTNVTQHFLVILIVKNAIVTLMDHQANNVTKLLETVLVFLILLDLNVIGVLMATSTFQIAQVLNPTRRRLQLIFNFILLIQLVNATKMDLNHRSVTPMVTAIVRIISWARNVLNQSLDTTSFPNPKFVGVTGKVVKMTFVTRPQDIVTAFLT